MTFLEKTILVTGGASFIGSHTLVQLLNEGFKVSIIDNLDNSVAQAVDEPVSLVFTLWFSFSMKALGF